MSALAILDKFSIVDSSVYSGPIFVWLIRWHGFEAHWTASSGWNDLLSRLVLVYDGQTKFLKQRTIMPSPYYWKLHSIKLGLDREGIEASITKKKAMMHRKSRNYEESYKEKSRLQSYKFFKSRRVKELHWILSQAKRILKFKILRLRYEMT